MITGGLFMNKKLKKVLAAALSLTMAFSLSATAFAENNTETPEKLKFNDDGKFKIVVFADTQDNCFMDGRLTKMMGDALDAEKPDLVIFTGDNVVQPTKLLNQAATDMLMQPVVDRGIPFAVTFGNHDGEYYPNKEGMFEYYQSFDGCLSYDADPEITGVGNCNLPVYSSDGKNIAYNLWIIDSNMYDEENGGYDHVHQDQIDWYVKTSNELAAQVGHKVPSLMFQHICVPEIYNCLCEVEEKGKDIEEYNDKFYELKLNDTAEGYLGEFPCPPKVNGGQFDAVVKQGDVVGIVTGHDHVNNFIGSYQGIDFIQFPGAGFESYGNDEVRGYGVITLDENHTDTYEAYNVTYANMYKDMSGAESFKIRVQAFFSCLEKSFYKVYYVVVDLLDKIAMESAKPGINLPGCN